MPLRGEFERFESVLGYFCKGWFFSSHYLRNSTTQYDMKIRMKSESAVKSLLPQDTATAVDYADTELIGQTRWQPPGFLVAFFIETIRRSDIRLQICSYRQHKNS